ncbi:MAG TPA: hypothetical protein VMR62_14280 [Bryobacteraceae bacterium]|jgi:hypothetical protein|nr:hypothetical protein [Bryobacteraceae bacterium]
MRCTALLTCALACALASLAFGDDQFTKEVHTITNYCDDAWKDKFLDRTQDGQCGQAVVNGSPLHLNAQMFAPGSGLALGLGYKRLFTFGQAWQNNWDLGGMGSVEGAWEGHFVAHFDKQRPAPSITDTTPVLHRIVEKFEIQPYASAQQLTKLDYYGEGPQSSRSALALYTERDIRVGVGVSIPLAWWLNAGATVEGLWPSIGPASTSTSPSVADFYRADPTLAPGIESQAAFTHYQFYLRPHLPRDYPYNLIYKIGYEYYQDHGSGQYSFGRFRADLLHNLYLEHDGKDLRRDSILSFYGRLTLSHTAAGNSVPFYLQDTLGGTDINGDPTVRAFPDYRFRDPDNMLIEVEFNRRIWKPLGIMLFYDAGQVVAQASDLSLGKMRQGFGGGLTIWSASKVVFRAYVGLGGGEGAHPFTGILPLPGPVAAPYRTYAYQMPSSGF